jgi:hypothetical protein
MRLRSGICTVCERCVWHEMQNLRTTSMHKRAATLRSGCGKSFALQKNRPPADIGIELASARSSYQELVFEPSASPESFSSRPLAMVSPVPFAIMDRASLTYGR